MANSLKQISVMIIDRQDGHALLQHFAASQDWPAGGWTSVKVFTCSYSRSLRMLAFNEAKRMFASLYVL